MILLVVGLVAVIVVIVIAVFLSIRLGGGDEHDDELDLTSSSHDQWAEEDDWQEPGVPGARPSPQPARAGRGSRDDDRRHAGEPAYSGARDYAEGPPRRTRRDPSEYPGSPPRRRSMVPASAESRGRYDTRASRLAPSADYPSADHPSMDFPPGEYAGEYATGDYDGYAGAGYPAVGYPGDAGGPDSRRPAAPAPSSGKSRSRQQRGKRADAGDWPSSEWDKLSDEQYWAELSADKPLATMARPAQPASPDRGQGRGQRSRPERPPQREAAAEHLPVRSRPRPPVPAATQPADSRPVPAGTHPSLDTAPYPVRDGGRHPSLDTAYPAPGTSRHPSLDTAPRPPRDPSLGMPARPARRPAPPVPGALEDDPLTSPSFSLKADPVTDSRSYGRTRKAPRAASDPLTSTGAGHAGRHDSGSYPQAGHSSPAHGYPAGPAPEYGDPYSYRGAPAAGPPAHHESDAGYNGYLADPLHVYSPPRYQPPGPAAYPGPPRPPYQALPSPEAATPGRGHAYPGGYPEPSYGPGPDQLDPPQRPRAAGGNGYAPGYDGGYGSDPYAAGEYGIYPPQG